ncbi:putative bifunctional diguanylate cyclase/phosphodiesterase [Pontibacter sp. JAM-7]|uniref:putative bifunctional diguanylate cyclase/phosphodiesterase n=1 Tax=Pontibacter sp. JAM-7 TaxID=3366581 RepID=UPI003AF6C5B4
MSQQKQQKNLGRQEFFSKEVNVASKVAFYYFIFAVTWIVLSDAVVEHLVVDLGWLSFIQTIKGLMFVLLSALLIFFLVNRYAHQLRQSELQLRTLFNTLPDLVWLKDGRGIYLSCNSKFERFFGAPEHEIIGKTDYDFVDTALADFFREHDLKAMHAGKASVNEEELVYADDGHVELVETIKTPVVDAKGNLIGVLGVGRDITQRKANEQEVKLLKVALEQSPVSIMMMDHDCRISFVNTAYERISGYSASEMLGEVPAFMLGEDGTTMPEITSALAGGQSWSGELSSRKRDGNIIWEYVSVSPVLDEAANLTHYLAVKEDITLRKQQEDRLWFHAHYDELTGLPNRMLVLDRLQQMIRDAERNQEQVAVLFLDLDDFKKINDTMGHDIGDKALREAARRLRSAVRAGDTVGRLGGDEFIVLAGRLNSEDSVPVIASHILANFQETFSLDERAISLTGSLGVAMYPQDGENPTELLKSADAAMYVAKDQGRDRFAFFEHSMNRKISRRLMIEEHLTGAIERQEMYLCYQPQVELNTGCIIGVEALLRWESPVLGNVRPDEFISVAEQTGQIVSIGRFVLQQALTAVSDWPVDLQNFKLAVNLSPRQLRDESLLAFIQDALQLARIPATSLELEITEGVLMSADKSSRELLGELRHQGISLALDDFGVGYSSLNYLRNYPFDLVKIDRSFVQDMTEDSGDRALVKAAVSMSHELGIKVLAEGVETTEQRGLLEQINCDYVQGFLFSRPVRSAELEEMLRQAVTL